MKIITRESQNQRIKKHLKSGKEINPYQALRLYGCFRLGARIFDLKKEGMKIKRRLNSTLTLKHHAIYYL